MQTGNIRAAREYTNMIIFGINAITIRLTSSVNVETYAGDRTSLRQKEIIYLAAKTQVSIHVYLAINQVSRRRKPSQTTEKRCKSDFTSISAEN